MTTEISNLTTSAVVQSNVPSKVQQKLQQLPSSISAKEQSDRSEADNVVRVNFSGGQKLATIIDVSTDVRTDQVNLDDNEAQNDSFGEASQSSINDSVSELNNTEQVISRNLEFHVDANSGRTVITVIDTNSNEVIRQIPSEQLLEISRRLKDLESVNTLTDATGNTATGILFTSRT